MLAAKFYCEGQDVVVNTDIARVLGQELEKLNSTEIKLASLFKFDLFVG